jgi:Methyltransferase domain
MNIVQQALDTRKGVYLEIGVDRGFGFRRITADEKIAVDPVLRLSARARRQADLKARATHYFEMTSDAFFANEADFLAQRGVDVALIDGLHTYQQVLRDVDNVLPYLRDDGVIVVHDCNPSSPSRGCPAESFADFRAKNGWWRLLWSGDVWKAIVALRCRDDLRVAVLDCDFGVGIVRKGTPGSRLTYGPEELAALDYADLVVDRVGLLNLRSPKCVGELLR